MFPLNGTYTDVKNNTFTNQVSIAPYSSVTLIKSTVQQSSQVASTNDVNNTSSNTSAPENAKTRTTQQLSAYPNPVANLLNTQASQMQTLEK